MNTKNYIKLSSLIAAILLSAPAMARTSIYDNNITALNINMLTDTFVSYTHHGTRVSDLFLHKKVYGTMTRVNQYGDNGTTVKGEYDDEYGSATFVFRDVWTDLKHIDGHAHYDKNISKQERFDLVTLGTNTRSTDLLYGNIYFGAFAGYINSEISYVYSNGSVGGIYAHYNFRNIDATVLTDIGSLNNNSGETDFNNSWTNVAIDTSLRFNIDKTFLVKPALYLAYTFVSSDDLYVNNNIVWSDNFNFLNIVPSVQFIKEIVPNWYGTLSAKYFAHFGGDNDIHIADTKRDGINIDDYTEIGIDVEYDLKRFVFGGQIQKQIGGFDGWSGNINVKYAF